MSVERVNRLDVWRTSRDGSRHPVGVLAQNRQGVFFQYTRDYLMRFANLSPFRLSFDASLQAAPRSPHAGLHEVFADSLPDGWGLLLMDRLYWARDAKALVSFSERHLVFHGLPQAL